MITGQLRNRVDQLWLEFWQGGIANPLSVVEQITYLMFMRLLDMNEMRLERSAKKTGKSFKGSFRPDQQALRWQNLLNKDPQTTLDLVRGRGFDHLRSLAASDSTFGRYMKDANLMISRPSLLVKAMEMINNLPLERSDIKGDLYEYVLSKLSTAGINGQFRTPRHIISLMVDLVEPKPNDVMADPACGTCGFPVAVMEYLLKHHTSPKMAEPDEEGNPHYVGDLLSEEQRQHLQNDMFHGFDFDVTMLRLAAMNMMLHGVESPQIHYQDTLSNSFFEKFPQFAAGKFTLILANPPFKGSLDATDLHSSLLQKVKTKKTELLFVVLMLRMLQVGGRCGVIVPDGVLFGSSNAHVALRKLLIDENQLEAVIKLPSGVFKPYAGVATAILLFAKGGKTENVFYYDVQGDGYTLDDKRDLDEANNDLPDVRTAWKRWSGGAGKKAFADRKAKAFCVPAEEIRANSYDLSLNRYKEVVHKEVEYDEPRVIIGRLKKLEAEIAQDLKDLEGMLK